MNKKEEAMQRLAFFSDMRLLFKQIHLIYTFILVGLSVSTLDFPSFKEFNFLGLETNLQTVITFLILSLGFFCVVVDLFIVGKAKKYIKLLKTDD